jgi:hypothetical protein
MLRNRAERRAAARQKGDERQGGGREQWAQPGDLTDKAYEDVLLPALGLMVRIRYLDTPDVARLQHLPDLTRFADLAAKIRSPIDVERAEVDPADLAAEQLKYYAYVAHSAVVIPTEDPGGMGEPVACEHCTKPEGEPVSHPPSLWGPAQTKRLQPQDLNVVMMVALQVQGRFGPFESSSTDQAPTASPSPAGTGA